MLAPNESQEQPTDGWGGAALPKRNPGTSPMAAAGARAGHTVALAGGDHVDHAVSRDDYTTVERLTVPPARRSPRMADIAAAVALLAAGGTALAFFAQHVGHAGRAGAAPSTAPAQSRAAAAPPV